MKIYSVKLYMQYGEYLFIVAANSPAEALTIVRAFCKEVEISNRYEKADEYKVQLLPLMLQMPYSSARILVHGGFHE